MVNSCVCFSSSPTSKPTTTLQLLATRLTRRSFVIAAASSSTATVYHRPGVCSGCGVAWRPHHSSSPRPAEGRDCRRDRPCAGWMPAATCRDASSAHAPACHAAQPGTAAVCAGAWRPRRGRPYARRRGASMPRPRASGRTSGRPSCRPSCMPSGRPSIHRILLIRFGLETGGP